MVADGSPGLRVEGVADDVILVFVASAFEVPAVAVFHVAEPGVTAVFALAAEVECGDAASLASEHGEVRLIYADAALLEDILEGVGAVVPVELAGGGAVVAVFNNGEGSAEVCTWDADILACPFELGLCDWGIDDEFDVGGWEA